MTEPTKANESVTPERVQTPQGPIVNLNVEGHVQIIHCEKNARRSSHWHKTDSHYLYVVSGCMRYWTRPVGSTDPPKEQAFFPGGMVFTGPNEEHWTEFPVETVLVSVSARHRGHDEHEADVVRVKWWSE